MSQEEHLLGRKRMVEEQIVRRGVHDPRLLSVMGDVPRHRFVLADDLAWAYADGPLPIGHGQTISQPYIVALMTDLLQLNGVERVLEVGTGSGYQAAVLGRMAAEVHTVEVIPELAAQATKILAELGFSNIQVHDGDGSQGWPAASPYNAILVAAAAPSVPQPLLDQLAEGGRLVIPVGDRGNQQLECWTRTGQKFERRVSLQVAFVPLRGEYGWK
ncbi:MAG TPA: protein-L-isoaspartate(D-aspartate) O-methyltransferase [Anaerolineales bacterium]